MRKILWISGMMLLAACAGQPQRPAGFETYRSATVQVTTGVQKGEPYVQALQERIVAALRERQVFSAVVAGDETSAADRLILQVNITRFVRVHEPLRIALGRMAGSNEVGADITLRDSATGQDLGTFHLQGESPLYPPNTDWPRGTIEIAMDRFAGALIEILLGWKEAGPPGGRASWLLGTVGPEVEIPLR